MHESKGYSTSWSWYRSKYLKKLTFILLFLFLQRPICELLLCIDSQFMQLLHKCI